MPRVSEEHRAARRRQILQAAWTCFATNGFHATSMADVIRESGLSAGAVYTYFPSKESLIFAVAESTIGQITDSARDRLNALDPPDPGTAVAMVLEQIITTLGSDGLDRTTIPLHVFGEAHRSPALMSLLQSTHGAIRQGFVEVARRAIAQGLLEPDADPEQIGAAMFGLMPGYIVQHITLGVSPEDYLSGVRALLGRSNFSAS